MDLQYFGLSCFRLRTKDASVIMDPYNPKDVGLSYPSLKADAVLYSDGVFSKKVKPSENRQEKSLNMIEITGSGEYEIGGIFITKSDNAPFYIISCQDINICYLGLLKGEISRDLFADIGDIDYLILPVGDGKEFVEWKDLEKIISDIDPAVLIPSCYLISGMKDKWKDLKKIEEFLKGFGISNPERQPKLKLKHFLDTDNKQLNTVILEPKIK